jgi:hypothetical protein
LPLNKQLMATLSAEQARAFVAKTRELVRLARAVSRNDGPTERQQRIASIVKPGLSQEIQQLIDSTSRATFLLYVYAAIKVADLAISASFGPDGYDINLTRFLEGGLYSLLDSSQSNLQAEANLGFISSLVNNVFVAFGSLVGVPLLLKAQVIQPLLRHFVGPEQNAFVRTVRLVNEQAPGVSAAAARTAGRVAEKGFLALSGQVIKCAAAAFFMDYALEAVYNQVPGGTTVMDQRSTMNSFVGFAPYVDRPDARHALAVGVPERNVLTDEFLRLMGVDQYPHLPRGFETPTGTLALATCSTPEQCNSVLENFGTNRSVLTALGSAIEDFEASKQTFVSSIPARGFVEGCLEAEQLDDSQDLHGFVFVKAKEFLREVVRTGKMTEVYTASYSSYGPPSNYTTPNDIESVVYDKYFAIDAVKASQDNPAPFNQVVFKMDSLPDGESARGADKAAKSWSAVYKKSGYLNASLSMQGQYAKGGFVTRVEHEGGSVTVDLTSTATKWIKALVAVRPVRLAPGVGTARQHVTDNTEGWVFRSTAALLSAVALWYLNKGMHKAAAYQSEMARDEIMLGETRVQINGDRNLIDAFKMVYESRTTLDNTKTAERNVKSFMLKLSAGLNLHLIPPVINISGSTDGILELGSESDHVRKWLAARSDHPGLLRQAFEHTKAPRQTSTKVQCAFANKEEYPGSTCGDDGQGTDIDTGEHLPRGALRWCNRGGCIFPYDDHESAGPTPREPVYCHQRCLVEYMTQEFRSLGLVRGRSAGSREDEDALVARVTEIILRVAVGADRCNAGREDNAMYADVERFARRQAETLLAQAGEPTAQESQEYWEGMVTSCVLDNQVARAAVGGGGGGGGGGGAAT